MAALKTVLLLGFVIDAPAGEHTDLAALKEQLWPPCSIENYVPKIVDTTSVHLEAELEQLVAGLAKNTHETWAADRIKEGWTWGAVRSDTARTHPNLVAFEKLPASEQKFDRDTAETTIKSLFAFGFTVSKAAEAHFEEVEPETQSKRYVRKLHIAPAVYALRAFSLDSPGATETSPIMAAKPQENPERWS
eukprot:TRINITY_DN12370_c0_g1_i1.p1 TRINITY_DN12370_c0_g1~~TRINITY_DN12370_c0_g1_i1.p1  ORF type:complete len:191 (-),score=47.09 TRINITY_DN12370_c0_g1_i1:13-585(-)